MRIEINDKIKRTIAFYIALALFCFLLPIILSYSLGYKIDYRKFKIYKTGLIYLRSTPAGASIHINGKLLSDITPAEIKELRPGLYMVEVRREGFYPWQKELAVKPNMVTKADEIVLFPIIKDMAVIGPGEIEHFAIPGRNGIYYMTKRGLLKSALDGTDIKLLSLHSDWPERILGKKFSPDGNKFLYFNDYKIWVVYVNLDKNASLGSESARVEEVLSTDSPIVDAFWYSTSGYIVLITRYEIKALELKSEGVRNVTDLYRFTARPKDLYYDSDNDSLYFTDLKKADGDTKEGIYIFRLDLRQKFFDQLTKRLKKEFSIQDEKR